MKQLLVAIFLFSTADDACSQYHAYRKLYFNGGGSILPYRLLSPVAAAKSYPLVIFLHGAFEKGDDNEQQLNIGGHFFLRDSIRKKYPAFILFPQCSRNDSWAYFENRIDYSTGNAVDWNFPFNKQPTAVTGLLLELVNAIAANDSVDRSRIYIAGLSQGGMGVLDIIARHPGEFAGAISICGAGDPSTARLFAGLVPLWLFHGNKDQVVPADFSRQYYRRLKRAGSDVRYTEYPEVEHNSWVKTFAEPELMPWLFAKTKKQN